MRPLLLLLALLPLLAHAQTPAFGERVGDVLDAEERAYFGLFPDVEGFVEARGVFGQHDTLRVALATEAGTTEERVLLPEQGVALREFVATFEQHPTAYLNPNWQVVRPFADPAAPVPYVNVERATVEVYADGRRFPGVVLLASDTLLVLQPEDVPYRWTADQALVLPTETITHVRPEASGLARHRTLGLGLSIMAGLAVMGATTVSLTADSFTDPATFRSVAIWTMFSYAAYEAFWPRRPEGGSLYDQQQNLKEQAQFKSLQPYDLPDPSTLLDRSATYPSAPATPPRKRSLLSRWHRTYGWFSLGLIAPSRTTDLGDPIVFNDYFINREPEQLQPREGFRNSFEIGESLDFSVRPIPWLRVGVTRHKYDVPEEININGEESAFMSPSGLRTYAELILPSPRYHGFGVDLAFGLGSEYNRVAVSRETSGSGRPLPFVVEHEGHNLFLQGTLELFTTPHSSVFVRYTRRDLPTLSVDYIEERIDILGTSDDLFYYAEAHEVTFGYSELTWGTRFHF